MSNEIAILMAAGLGSRMRPLTLKTPKPLIPINGIPMIETVIKSLEKRGIDDIYIVVGYKMEQFYQLSFKYPNVHFIKNLEFETKNNINSIAVVADKMCQANCFICEADLFVADENVLCREFKQSGYFGKFVNGMSNDWVFNASKEFNKLHITNICKCGCDCYNMVGISYFKKSDAMLIANAVLDRINNKSWSQKFWDDVVNELVKDGLDLTIYPIENDKIIECDTVEELYQLQNQFLNYKK